MSTLSRDGWFDEIYQYCGAAKFVLTKVSSVIMCEIDGKPCAHAKCPRNVDVDIPCIEGLKVKSIWED